MIPFPSTTNATSFNADTVFDDTSQSWIWGDNFNFRWRSWALNMLDALSFGSFCVISGYKRGSRNEYGTHYPNILMSVPILGKRLLNPILLHWDFCQRNITFNGLPHSSCWLVTSFFHLFSLSYSLKFLTLKMPHSFLAEECIQLFEGDTTCLVI